MNSSKVDEAFERFPRKLFLPVSGADRADVDAPISIGHGQTNSQPSTVRQMLIWLNVKPGAHVLDVGSGSGWTTALLSHLVGKSGDIVATELVAELVRFGRENCERAGVNNAVFHKAGKVYGWPDEGPYDSILVSASADILPMELVDQLRVPGVLVIPIRNTIYEIIKDVSGIITEKAHLGYIFVPLIAPR